ncbi:hypothetical protein H8L32_23025 [Undibacterium sp. CY18W]|uniref:Uncharacterized protein n=1 Tax=Undibacterium hunanense TaxID=2762292 RepID=A0ABR6ZXP6_9BURK|nr:hypothetical protein [Undibacterium hunanense]MBC3920355.1 hypothetical protein [Undibacterium hunanense]
MLDYARAEFFLSQPQKDGKPLRWHLTVAHDAIAHFDAASSMQYIPAELRDSWDLFVNPPQLPFELEYLWRWFLELHNSRSNNGMGPSVITYQDLLAWSHMTGNQPRKFELDAIRQLDRIYFEAMDKENDTAA